MLPIRLCGEYPVDSKTLNATEIQGRKVNNANGTTTDSQANNGGRDLVQAGDHCLVRTLKVERMAASRGAAACTKAR